MTDAPTRRPGSGLLRPALALGVVAVLLTEIWTVLQVAGAIGVWWTLVLLVLDTALGAWLITREGARAWRALRESVQSGRQPTQELADGALVLVGGLLILLPGFLLDLVGLVLLLPFTRPVARRMVTSLVGRRVVAMPGPGFGTGFGPGSGPGDARRPGPGGDGPVVRGDVVE